jgi:hypothetical protein
MTQPEPKFGSTLWTGPNAWGNIDVDPTGRQATGIDVLAQRLVLRQTTPLGSVVDAPNDCFDINDWLSTNMTDGQISQLPSQIQSELIKDQQVLAVVVSVQYTPQNATLTVVENIQSAFGPFSLTLNVGPGQVSYVVGQITGNTP